MTPKHSACSESVGGPSGAARGAVAALPAHPRRRQEVFAAADGPPGRPQNGAERHVSLLRLTGRHFEPFPAS